MAKKSKKVVEVDPILIDEDLLSGVEVKVTEDEVKAVIKPAKEKKFIGYHPISGEEVWI